MLVSEGYSAMVMLGLTRYLGEKHNFKFIVSSKYVQAFKGHMHVDVNGKHA